MNTEKKKVKNTSFIEECLTVPTLSLWLKKKGVWICREREGKKRPNPNKNFTFRLFPLPSNTRKTNPSSSHSNFCFQTWYKKTPETHDNKKSKKKKRVFCDEKKLITINESKNSHFLLLRFSFNLLFWGFNSHFHSLFPNKNTNLGPRNAIGGFFMSWKQE